MKIKIKRLFCVQVSATKTKEFQPGVYAVPGDISADVAEKALKFGSAEILVEKVAPENKAVEAPEDKTRVAKKSGYRRSTRSKSKPAGS